MSPLGGEELSRVLRRVWDGELYEAQWHWIEAALQELESTFDPLSSEILKSGRLRPGFGTGALDRIDLYSASLISAALERKRSTLIVLPDGQVRRPAFLFAYTLLNVWWRAREVPSRPKVLYCGATPGIREQLAKIRVSGLRLDSVFDQVDLPRGGLISAGRMKTESDVSPLPRAITAYAPADSRSLISELRPRCIAIDYDDSGNLPWLADVLEAARECKTTVLCWGTNPLSHVRREFSTYGDTVVWPFGRGQAENAEFGLDEPPEVLFQPFSVTDIRPQLVTGAKGCAYTNALELASAKLREVSRRGLSAFGATALQEHWKLYRDVESLHIPLEILEAEAPNFWGASSPSRSLAICRRFGELLATREPKIAASLSAATAALGDAVHWLTTNEPPLWQALRRSVDAAEEPGRARLITFTNRTKKSLFLFALLAKLNLTEQDLRERQKWLVTLDGLRRSAGAGHGLSGLEDGTSIPRHLTPIPMLVGIPGAHANPKLWPVFLADEAELLANLLQSRTIAWRVGDWSNALSMDLPGLTQTLSSLLRLPAPSPTPPITARVELGTRFEIDFAAAERGKTAASNLFVGPDLDDEMALLFDEDIELDGLGGRIVDEPGANEDYDPWVETAFELKFVGGWHGRFEPAARLNYVDREAGQLEERYVRSLRAGDTVLLVPMQRRQALYDLVIARVHQHPAIQLHLALLERWHRDLVQGYKVWSAARPNSRFDERPIERLLKTLRGKGSRLSSTLAVEFWISGATLCPIDPEDIKRVAEILALDFVESHYRKIAQAASRIRGLHRGLSNRLNHWLHDRAQGGVASHDQAIIDDETGLTFGEVRDSFVITEVKESTAVVGPFLRSSLGIISRGAL